MIHGSAIFIEATATVNDRKQHEASSFGVSPRVAVNIAKPPTSLNKAEEGKRGISPCHVMIEPAFSRAAVAGRDATFDKYCSDDP